MPNTLHSPPSDSAHEKQMEAMKAAFKEAWKKSINEDIFLSAKPKVWDIQKDGEPPCNIPPDMEIWH